MANIVQRVLKGSPLTLQEHDDNFNNLNAELATKATPASVDLQISTAISVETSARTGADAAEVTNRNAAITASSASTLTAAKTYTDSNIATEVTNRNSAVTTAVTTLKGGVATDGDTLGKLRALITGTNTGVNTGDETLATIKTKLGITTLSGVNTGDQTNITGNAGTASKLATARTINGIEFDGTASININAVDSIDRVAVSTLGVANGVATLGSDGKVLSTQLPSYVDDILEGSTLAAFPAVGEIGKIYVALDTNKTYRWSGSAYVYITSGAVDSVAGKTGIVSLVKADVGLSNVDNTPDTAKPVSTAQATADSNVQATASSDATTKANTAQAAAIAASTPIAHAGSTGSAHGVATTVVAGFLSAADKSKLDGIAAGATTNLGTVTNVTGTGAINSTGGTTPVISIVAATTLVPGTMSASDKAKLDGVSGNNTGDESTASIQSKLGIITLSGSNTGDESGSTIKAKLGITAISGTNTGDQTTITGNAGTATKLATARTINGVAFDGTANILNTEWIHSGRDFPLGTMIVTSINYAVSEGQPYVLEIKGNSYGSTIPFDVQCQGYIYSNTIIQHGGYSNGTTINGIIAINVGGFLTFWFPSGGYWQGFNAKAYVAQDGSNANCITNIINSGKPVGTKEVDLSTNIKQSWHTGNLTNLNQLTNGPGYITATSGITGNATTATVLQTPRTINGVAFDGGSNITINAVDSTTRVASTAVGVANGVASLDSNGLVPADQLPSYVDDVLEYANLSSFPVSGIAGKIYVALDTNKTYRWSGSTYIYITSGAVDSVAGKNGIVVLVKADVGLANVDNTADNTKTVNHANTSAASNRILFNDRRSDVQTPGHFGAGTDWSFMSNSTDGLSDGGTYHGVMHYQPYNDASGGGAYEIGFTDNNNLWLRGSSGALTTWAPWKKIWDSSNLTNLNQLTNGPGYITASSLPTTLPANDVYSWAKQATKPTYNKSEVGLSNVDNTADSVKNVSFSTYSAATAFLDVNPALTYGSNGLNYFNMSGTAGNSATVNSVPTSDWHHILRMNHANGAGYYVDIAAGLNSSSLNYRRITGGVAHGWYSILDSNNYNNFSPTLTGIGANGTWGISITGSAASTNTLTGFTNSNSTNPIVGADSAINNGIGYVNGMSLFGQSDGALYTQAYNVNYAAQIFQDYRTGQIALRGKNNSNWTGWKIVWDNSNLTNLNQLANGPGYITASDSITGSASSADYASASESANTANYASTAGMADNATKLATARTINGVAFDGSANITIETGAVGNTVSVIGINTNAVTNTIYVMTGSLVLTLPSNPASGNIVYFSNRSNTKTITIARNGQLIMGLTQDMVIDSLTGLGSLVFADATRGWVLL